MKHTRINRILSAVLAVLMVAALLPIQALAAGKTYVLDVSSDMEPFAAGERASGTSDKFGTDGYFILHYGDKMKLDASNKSFSDGVKATQRINFQSKTDTSDWSYSLEFTCASAATVKIWWVAGGDGRRMTIFDSQANIVAAEGENLAKNDLCISTFSVSQAGTYYIGSLDGSNYIFRVEVTESQSGGTVSRGDWASVAAPSITEAADDGNGNIVVSVNADVSTNGGDKVTVTMYDAAGKAVDTMSSVSGQSHSLTFTPDASGTYSFQAALEREGEIAKTSEKVSAAFALPLKTPAIISATSKGGGKVEVVWGAVAEAASYEVYCDGSLVGTTTDTSYVVSGLNVGSSYSFTVAAVRGEERKTSEAISAKATANAQQAWGFTVYGPSTNTSANGYTGDLNADGKVTVYSTGGKGKIQPADGDGIAFYYTAVPTNYNFTLRATVTVDSWTFSNGQEGFGLMATDMLGENGSSATFFNNSYMAGCTKIEYRYESGLTYPASYAAGTKYSMKLGLGVIAKTGVTAKNQDTFGKSDAYQNYSVTETLEWAAGDWEKDAGTYNIVGNETSGNITGTNIEKEMKTSFILEIQKNNTGYFITYYAADGTVLCQRKYYGADDLSQLDKDFVYVGFFASRNATATFSDVEFSTILASEDAPAEEIPHIEVKPTLNIVSGEVTTSQDYQLLVDTNVDGLLTVQVGSNTVLTDVPVTGGQRYSAILPLEDYGQNTIRVRFDPDPDQDLGENTVLSSTDTLSAVLTVTWNKGNYHSKVIYVAPDGVYNGDGSREHPYDLYTAVNNVVPGQTIVLLEGTYPMITTLTIQRGMDGTEDAPIAMIADPEAKTRPVLDFQGTGSGIVHGGNYWYFYGFDVTNSMAGQKGFLVGGSYNTLDQVNAYHNGNTGIQISRLKGTDQYDAWPAYNLILNCTSYGNCDPGYEDADGFAAKLTVGDGNVFDGCAAYNNADDGYDLYAKPDTGIIGVVTIRNCIAYANGYLEDGTDAGNGNGFKLGGSSMSGKHVLENCIAFHNKTKGIDSNSCPDVVVINCTSYNNGSYNVAMYTNNNYDNTDFSLTGVVSFRNADDSVFVGKFSTGENLKPQGTQNTSKIENATNYYWNGEVSINTKGAKITADMFVSLTWQGLARKADGTLDMRGFLELNEKAPADAGARMTGTASQDNSEIVDDSTHEFGEEWANEDPQYHWHECECGAKSELMEHTFQWIIDKEATETANGQKHEECTVCGYKKAAITVYPGEEQEPSAPETTGPAAQEGTNAADGATDGDGEKAPNNTWIIVVLVIAVIAVGAVTAVLVIKKKKA